MTTSGRLGMPDTASGGALAFATTAGVADEGTTVGTAAEGVAAMAQATAEVMHVMLAMTASQREWDKTEEW